MPSVNSQLPQKEEIGIFDVERNIVGEIYFLKKKSRGIFSGLIKHFVVVYAELGNSKEVGGFLAGHLPERKMTSTSDLGLVFYEFK